MAPFVWKQRRGLNRVSDGQADKNARRVEPRAAQLREYPFCEANAQHAPGNCYGPLQCHEPWTRARGGPIDDRRNMTTVCSQHNRAISQDVETMRWAEANEFLIAADDGPAWLEGGGFQR